MIVEGDAVRLSQILTNLLHNAAKYTPAGGQISLTVRREGSEVLVSVKDTGIGIPAEMLPRIFEMFAQVDRALDRPTSGLGIGLTLTKSLVELHGGTLSASSGGANCGSEFVVRLPVAELGPTTATTLDRGRDLPRESNHCRVLVVDDNRDAAEMMEMTLKVLGHDVRLAFDGLEAVQLAESFRPDAAFLDLGMPKMNGHEAARTIRSSPWGAKMLLVALSGWGQEEDKRRALEAGFDFHFAKPVETSVLQDLLNELKRSTSKIK
jgi:CheY-like chemotaxis protein/anti-sigma regulatory factor (Ser/Thr protein kinase)